MENNDFDQPRIVSSHDIRIDTDYADWIAEVKHRYRSAQVKAAVRVNAEKLQRAIEELQHTINQLSKKLYQVGKEFPLPFALVPWNEFKNRITDN